MLGQYGVHTPGREGQAMHAALLVSNNIAGDRDSSGSRPPLTATSHERDISSAYAELLAPITKTLELQAALRHDRYEGVGSSTNPKLGLCWQPTRMLVLRASASTGFRAPSFSELYRPTSYGTSPAFLYDAFDQYPTNKESNPEPRKVKAYSLWDLSLSWRATEQLQLRGGMLNLLDTDPPFSNQSYYFLSTYDPTYTDPRGRTFYLSAKYGF
jgi:iron complex outermembrane receptor protein